MHAGQGSVQWTAEVVRNLAELLALVNALADDLPLLSRELIEKVAQPSRVIGAFYLIERARQRVRRAIGRDRDGAEAAGAAGLMPAQQHGLVIGHREQPAAQVLRINAIEALQSPHECLLQSVLGLMGITQHAKEETVEGRFVPVEQRIEGGIVAGAKSA